MPIALGVSSMGVSTSLDTNGERAELKATGCRPPHHRHPGLDPGSRL